MVCIVNISLIEYDSCILHLSQNTKSKTRGLGKLLASLAKGNMKDHKAIWCRDALLGINFQNQLCAPCYILKYLSNLSMQSFAMFSEINKVLWHRIRVNFIRGLWHATPEFSFGFPVRSLLPKKQRRQNKTT